MKTTFYICIAYLMFFITCADASYEKSITLPVQNKTGMTLSCVASTEQIGHLTSCPTVTPNETGNAIWEMVYNGLGGEDYQTTAAGTIEYSLQDTKEPLCTLNFYVIGRYDGSFQWLTYSVSNLTQPYTCTYTSPRRGYNSSATGYTIIITPK